MSLADTNVWTGISLCANQQRGPFTRRKEPVYIYEVRKFKTYQVTHFELHCQTFTMASSAGSFQEVPDSEEASQVSSPVVSVCRCENQLAHWDWAGRVHPNLPESCRPRFAIGNGPGGVTHLEMESQIAVDDGIGKTSVQLLK
jgi:hypothetical protein